MFLVILGVETVSECRVGPVRVLESHPEQELLEQ